MPLYELIFIIRSLWPVTTRTRNPGTNTPQKHTNIQRATSTLSFVGMGRIWRTTHTRAMSTRTWNMAHVKWWYKDMGLGTWESLLFFGLCFFFLFAFLIFPFPRRFGLFPPLLRFSYSCILFPHYCPPPPPILQPLYCISFLRSFPYLKSSLLFFSF